MREETAVDRRSFMGAAAAGLVAAQLSLKETAPGG
jgi:hypothetical protein